ncbi:hypothetical protein JCM6882_000290 [Rhodosporidiobolus microsporus]
MRTLELNDRALWSWRQAPAASTPSASASPDGATSTVKPTEGFQPCAQFPSQIHVELLATKAIPDPFLKRNEELVQWVGETDWIYLCTFDLPEEKLPKEGASADLVFEGLDTFATVFLNGKKLVETDNMHREYRIPTASALTPGRNALYIHFSSAFRRGRALEEEHLGKGKHWPCWNGDASRLFVRKAGYNYGWDWGPVLMTAGPYRPVRLEVYQSRIFDFWPRATVSDKLDSTLSLSWQIDAPSQLLNSLSVHARIARPDGTPLRKVSLAASEQPGHEWKFEDDEVELWWTNGLGKQPLYQVEVELVDMRSGSVLHTVSRKVGFRRIRIVREPVRGEPGNTFLFEINNMPIFAGGSNWIPADSFLTNLSDERYRRWLELAKEGKQNMVRVWGGGVYEPEVFYETCDELGLLVWQDFMFACGAYPAQVDDFRQNIKLEAEGVVKRLRSHPSLAIFAGNNEDYQIAEAENLEYDPKDQDGDWLRTSFPARELYERILPSIVHAHSDIFSWPSSPWGGEKTTDPHEGDLHCWNVWHGSQEPYQKFGELGGRFVSEFGMEGAPDIRTLDYLLDSDKKERFPQSRTLCANNNASGFERRLALYLTENIRFGNSLEDYVFATQLIQSEAVTAAYHAWRRRFTGGIEGALCAGALVWQLNDCWPTTSWAIVDYFLRPKPAYFAIKRALAPLVIGGRRYRTKTFSDPHSALFEQQSWVDLWAGNSLLEAKEVDVEVEAFELLTGKRVHHEKFEATLESNRSAELKKLQLKKEWDDERNAVVVTVKLTARKSKEVLSRVSLYPEPFKFLTFPSPSSVALRVTLDRSAGTVTAVAARPVKGLILSFSTDVKLSDNGLDLIPGEEQVVEVEGLKKGTEVSWRYLGDEHAP